MCALTTVGPAPAPARPGSGPSRMPRCRWPGCCRSGRAAPRPFGGFPWARLAFSQADSPLAPLARFAGAPGLTFAVAALGVLLHLAARELTHRVGRPRRGAPRHTGRSAPCSPSSRWRRSGSRWRPPRPRTGARCPCCSCRATCPSPGWTSTPSAARCSTTTSRPPSRAVADRPPRAHARRLAGELLRHRPAAQRRRRRRHPARGRDGQGPAARRRGPRRDPLPTSPTPACSTCPDGGDPQRYVKQHPVPFAEYIPYRSFFRNFSDKVDLVTQGLHPRRPGRRLRGAGRGGAALLDHPHHLLRGGLRRVDARLDPPAGTRRQHPGRADQQRDVRLHRRVGAAVRDQPAAGDRARPLGRARLDRRRQRLHQPRRNVRRQDVVVHRSGPLRVAGGPHRGHPVATGWAPCRSMPPGWPSRVSWHWPVVAAQDR